ncbi:tetratricopeptide repeat protein [Clostridium sp. YIM B02551]|uniref:tetratricopeptide repeat protein n=1 Tax=Clostridium sp. YIM B02551 TaxID=2910679 RepID=UPI001EEC58CA|nr:tetratricopeptide repeat protein [Clostridium sp. YIM B02551]
MFRIKLPGSRKFKIALLSILVIIIIGVLVKQSIDNKKELDRQNKVQEQLKEKEASEIKEKNDQAAKAKLDAENKQKSLDEKAEKAREVFYTKDYESAISLCNEILNEDNSNYKAYSVRGIAKAYTRDYSGAMQDIDKSLEIKPDYGYAMFNKGLLYELQGEFMDAIEWYNKDLEVENYVWSYYGIASIYGRKGDVDNTVNYLSKAIELDSAVKETAKEEHDFDPVRDSEKFSNLIK